MVVVKEPWVYLALAILEQAHLDYGKSYNRDGERGDRCGDSLWGEWLETDTSRQGVNKTNCFDIASAIGNYLEVK